MTRSKWIVIGGLCLLALRGFAADPLSGTCTADFAVKATMDSFVGHAKSTPITLDPARDETLMFTVSIEDMVTGKVKRDREMFHMFESSTFPTIVGTAALADISALDPAAGHNQLSIVLTMHGVTKAVMASISALNRSDEALAFDAAFTVPLREFGLTPPSIMKLIRVGNEVKVTAHVALVK